MCRGEMRSSLGVVKLGILRLRLSRGLDARGCRLLRRRSVMPWWQRGSYATTKACAKFAEGGKLITLKYNSKVTSMHHLSYLSVDKDYRNANIYFYMVEYDENMTKSYHASFLTF